MNIFMLGWEYPPHISGGLGTACEGLTKALSGSGVSINFVVPHLTGDENGRHMVLLDANEAVSAENTTEKTNPLKSKVSGIRYHKIPSSLNPYENEETFEKFYAESESAGKQKSQIKTQPAGKSPHYSNNLFDEVFRYSYKVSALSGKVKCDVIHMHDWMTFPAGVRASLKTDKPLVAHIHSLEFDRAGENGNRRIVEIEKAGLEQADMVIAVSNYTKHIICDHYGIPLKKVKVVHNGITTAGKKPVGKKSPYSKTVLFLGRVTFQKGPDYLIEAAAKVIQYMPDVRFVIAGSGDMLEILKYRVHELGLTEYFDFPGFLRGKEVERALSSADLYVMPSVSEPFGIAPLEAVSCNTPVLISKQSGVSEVLRHALKVDFWDINRMADLIINALLYPELRNDLSQMAGIEIKNLRWDSAARKVKHVYDLVLEHTV